MSWARGCHTEFKTVYKNEFIETEEEICETINEEWCDEVCKPHDTTECKPHWEEKCTWEKHTECKDNTKWIQVPYKETECEKKKIKVCDSEWENTESGKIWAEISEILKMFVRNPINPTRTGLSKPPLRLGGGVKFCLPPEKMP